MAPMAPCGWARVDAGGRGRARVGEQPAAPQVVPHGCRRTPGGPGPAPPAAASKAVIPLRTATATSSSSRRSRTRQSASIRNGSPLKRGKTCRWTWNTSWKGRGAPAVARPPVDARRSRDPGKGQPVRSRRRRESPQAGSRTRTRCRGSAHRVQQRQASSVAKACRAGTSSGWSPRDADCDSSVTTMICATRPGSVMSTGNVWRTPWANPGTRSAYARSMAVSYPAGARLI